MHRLLLLLALPLFLALAGCQAIGPEREVVYFAANSSQLDPPARQIVATMAEKARQRPAAAVVVTGYADPIGAATDNRKLAAQRIKAVIDALAAAGLAPGRVQRRNMGGVDFSLDSIESRRVEITLGEP